MILEFVITAIEKFRGVTVPTERTRIACKRVHTDMVNYHLFKRIKAKKS